MLRAGVIGLRRGRNHVRVLQAMPGVTVAGVADIDADVAERVGQEFGVPRRCTSLAELLDVGLDLLVVATPMTEHAAPAIAALDRGVHVMSEVPAVASVGEAEALIAAVERSGQQYMMGENCCYWAFIDTTRQMHARGDFGRIFYAEAEYIHDVRHLMHDARGEPTWRYKRPPITYITHSLGPILSVTGQYPVEITCYGTTDNYEPGMIDLQVAILKLSGGAVARVTVSFSNAHWGHHRYHFLGTNGSLDSGWVNKDEPRFWSTALPNIAKPITLPVGTNFPGAPAVATLGGHGTAEWYMYRDFLKAIAEGTRPPIDVYDAVMYSLPGFLARDSAAAGGKPVAIPQFQQRRR